jgi:hypothetical protein
MAPGAMAHWQRQSRTHWAAEERKVVRHWDASPRVACDRSLMEWQDTATLPAQTDGFLVSESSPLTRQAHMLQ